MSERDDPLEEPLGDPLDALRAQWSNLVPPDPDRPDARDEARVAALRAAWQRLVPPTAELPAALRRRPVGRTAVRMAVRALREPAALLVGAAAVLVAVLVLATRDPVGPALPVAHDDGHMQREVGTELHGGSDAPAAADSGAASDAPAPANSSESPTPPDTSPLGRDRVANPLADPLADPLDEAPTGELDDRGRLVLRRGAVRLVWLEPTPPPPIPNTQP